MRGAGRRNSRRGGGGVLDPAAYEAFTQELVRRLAAQPRVVGVVALGSMARRDYAPDRFSDHDFFVVCEPGAQDGLRAELGWLPRRDEVVLAYQDTPHGLKVLYRDGHLCELAVFDPDELSRFAKVNRYRVLLDRGDLQARLAAAAADGLRASPPDEVFLLRELVTALVIGAGRVRRGEHASGRARLQEALRLLLVLLARHLPSPAAALLDGLDPYRRFEQVYPELGRALEAAQAQGGVALGRWIAEVAERELGPRVPGFPTAALRAVQETLLD